jgi:HEPN domain-containing protein
MDEPQLREIRTWLDKALQDLRSAEWLLENPYGLYNAVGFHCQQVGEKVLKAYLTRQERPFEKTHSLVALVSHCLQFDGSFNQLRQAAVTLTPYAVIFRYPGDLPELSKDDADQAISFAKQMWNFVINRLPPEAQPQ